VHQLSGGSLFELQGLFSCNRLSFYLRTRRWILEISSGKCTCLVGALRKTIGILSTIYKVCVFLSCMLLPVLICSVSYSTPFSKKIKKQEFKCSRAIYSQGRYGGAFLGALRILAP
jgi:hypothetical protein